MQLVITLRHKEQTAIAFLLETLRLAGWTYDGFIPGIEFTNGAARTSLNSSFSQFSFIHVDKDQWFSLLFHSNQDSVPAAVLDYVIDEKRFLLSKRRVPVPLATRIATYPPIELPEPPTSDKAPYDGTW
jgi:hypothetical protein